jgi:hypothetical protein
MTLKEINKERQRIKQLRKEGKMTLLRMAKHLDTLDRLESKLKN